MFTESLPSNAYTRHNNLETLYENSEHGYEFGIAPSLFHKGKSVIVRDTPVPILGLEKLGWVNI
jgi:hypothetical protein